MEWQGLWHVTRTGDGLSLGGGGGEDIDRDWGRFG